MTESYMKKLSSTLLDAITDKDPLVQEQVCSALCSLGEVQPVEMLRACEEYLRQHDKLVHPYREAVLRAMARVLSSRASELVKDTASTIILLASSEMTKMKDLVGAWQQAASGLLVAVGRQFISKSLPAFVNYEYRNRVATACNSTRNVRLKGKPQTNF
ncbi:Maestro heat-like repeat-containing protein member 1 [Saguinus oedipus]|uniref:Maestro heat-like repeat-containing protein member 1 n=1 Tax=Saguinus oedipus TaxID=9490 RepID=A0ABQ9W984_SAGOE|nr:Maestro heat-like repeat-containing protein member 1 [Saguinus oedipus]